MLYKTSLYTKEITMSSIENWKAELIMENFEYGDMKELSEKTHMKIGTIHGWARKRGLKRKAKRVASRKLSEEHENLLLKMYPSGDFDLLAEKLGKNKHAISELARRRGLKREVCDQRKGTLEPLFSKTLESFYWLGFIAADGYISKTGHFMVSQSEKDKETIDKLAVYLNTSIYIVPRQKSGFDSEALIYRVNVADKVLGIKLREMLGIQDDLPKTYTGINLDFIKTEEQASAFFIGYLDGDGSLNKKSISFTVECHASWYETLKKLMFKLPKEMQNINLRVSLKKSHNKDYCQLSVRNSSSLSLIKFAHENNLPCSSRKFPTH